MGIGSWFKRVWRAAGSSQGPGTAVRSFGWGPLPARKGTRELYRMYSENPWLFAVHNRLARERASGTKLEVFSGPEDDPTRQAVLPGDPRHEVLDVWARPVRLANGRLLTTLQRIKMLALFWELSGEAYLLKQRGRSPGPGQLGRVTGLVPCSPLWVISTPTVAEPRYLVQASPDKPAREIDPWDVIPLDEPDPLNPFGRGAGRGATYADELDTDEGCSAAARAVVANMGRPSGVLVLDLATQEQLEQQRVKWAERFGGPARAGQVELARGKAATWIPLSVDELFSNALEARKFFRDTFIQTAGLSGELFGVLDGATRDSAYVARYHMALGAIVPWCAVVADGLQTYLVPEFAEAGPAYIGFKSPVPEDKEFKARLLSIAPTAFRGRDARQLGDFAPDPELDELPLTHGPALATPSQLPTTPGEKRKRGDGRALTAGDPPWAAEGEKPISAMALACAATSRVGSKP